MYIETDNIDTEYPLNNMTVQDIQNDYIMPVAANKNSRLDKILSQIDVNSDVGKANEYLDP